MATVGTAPKEQKARPARGASESVFAYEGKDRNGRIVRGELRAQSEAVANAQLRRQNIKVTRLRKQRTSGGGRITDRDVTQFTRQMATMLKAGVPLLQGFDIVGRGNSKPAVTKLLHELRMEVETGSSLTGAFAKHPKYFSDLYVNLVGAGERGGVLDVLLERLASYQEKSLSTKAKVKKALTYPVSILVVSAIVLGVIMVFVIPAFKQVFSSFGANLPTPTLVVMAMSDFVVKTWYIIVAVLGLSIWGFKRAYANSLPLRVGVDKTMLKLPVFGPLLHKASIARWTGTLATMFSAGVPLVEALDSVGGAVGNHVYLNATRAIQTSVSTGRSLTQAVDDVHLFPNMVIQMISIGEESGSLDSMLSKVADIYDEEVDNAVENLSSLMEPFIMVFLGLIIGSIIISMYLPIFKLGEAV